MSDYIQRENINAMMPQMQQAIQVQPHPIAPKRKPSAALGAPPAKINKEATTNARDEDNNTVMNQVVQYEQEDPLLQDAFNESFNFDVNAVLDDIEQNVAISQIDTTNSKSTTLQCQTIKKTSPKIPIFNNCKIGSIGQIHFHIHKN